MKNERGYDVKCHRIRLFEQRGWRNERKNAEVDWIRWRKGEKRRIDFFLLLLLLLLLLLFVWGECPTKLYETASRNCAKQWQIPYIRYSCVTLSRRHREGFRNYDHDSLDNCKPIHGSRLSTPNPVLPLFTLCISFKN